MNIMKHHFSKTLTYTRSLAFASLVALLGLGLVLGTGCATLRPSFETPSVNVTTFKLLSIDSLMLQFEIGLRVLRFRVPVSSFCKRAFNKRLTEPNFKPARA